MAKLFQLQSLLPDWGIAGGGGEVELEIDRSDAVMADTGFSRAGAKINSFRECGSSGKGIGVCACLRVCAIIGNTGYAGESSCGRDVPVGGIDSACAGIVAEGECSTDTCSTAYLKGCIKSIAIVNSQ